MSAFLRRTIRGTFWQSVVVWCRQPESNVCTVLGVLLPFNAVAFGLKGQVRIARSATAQQKQNLLQKQVLSYGRTRKMGR